MTSFVLYTHSSYNDCWDAFFARNKKHFNLDFDNYYIFTDKVNHTIDERFEPILYKDDDSYTNRLLGCLNQIKNDYVFFTHEDMMLYDDINKQYMQECIDTIQDVDFIKMLKGGGSKDLGIDMQYENSRVLKIAPFYYEFLFAIQPSLWNRQSFINLLANNLNQSIWDFEIKGQEFCRQNDFQSLYTYVDGVDKQRGMAHYDSITYPYIATAIFKGKWTTDTYKEELTKMSQEFGLDLNVRGCIGT